MLAAAVDEATSMRNAPETLAARFSRGRITWLCNGLSNGERITAIYISTPPVTVMIYSGLYMNG